MTTDDSNMTNIEIESATSPATSDQLVEQGLEFHRNADFSKAGRFYKQAVQMDPGNASAFQFLGLLANQVGKSQLAVSMLEQAISLSPELALAHYNLGVALTRLGRNEEAVASYEHALSLPPDDVQIYQDPAQLYLEHQEMDKAIQCFKQVEDRFKNQTVSLQARINMGFGLAKIFSGLKENAGAMACLIQANELKRSTIEYDMADTKALFSSIKHVFSKQFMEKNKLVDQPDRIPVFVSGMPGSGTAKVEKILSSHPKVFSGGELFTLKDVFTHHVSGLNNMMQVTECGKENFEAAQTQYIKETHTKSENALFITDRMSQNFLFIGFIYMIFPRARIIHCKRDPMETCFSIYQQLFTNANDHPYGYDQKELGQYYNLYANLMEHWKTVIPAGIIHEVEYEALAGNHEQETSRLLKFLELDRDDACLEFDKNPGQIKTQSVGQALKLSHNGSSALWKTFEKGLEPLKNALLGNLPSSPFKKLSPEHLEKRPQPSNNQIQRVIKLFQAGDMVQVEQRCKKMLKNFPDSYILLNLLGASIQALGRLEEAIAAFDRMLEFNARFAQGYYNRGVAHSQMGQTDKAIEDYSKAVEIDPDIFSAHLNLGIALGEQGHFSQAIQSLDRAIAIEPDNALGYNNRAFSLMNAGNMNAALKDCEKAIAINPNFPEIYNIRGLIYDKLGNNQKAADSFKKGLELKPGSVQFQVNLAKNLNELIDFEKALEYCNQAVQSHPNSPDAYYNKGIALHGLVRYEEAVKSYDRAIELSPKFSEAFCNRGICFHRLGLIEKGFADFNQAIELDPENVRAYSNRGLSHRFFGQFDEAEKDFEHALSIDPDHGSTRLNRALLYLVTGNYEQGWIEYEWRWKKSPKRLFLHGKAWDGEPLSGKSIFIYGEQGFGDFIQFVRYLPLLRNMGAIVILETRPALGRLMINFKGYDRLEVQTGDKATQVTDRFDYHLPIMSLPRLFKSTFETIPSKVPYLTADKDLKRIWQGRIKKGNALCVGVVWAGNPSHKGDRRRSVNLSRFLPLKQIKGINLYSLQKETHELWTDQDPETIFTQDFGKEISDFADTAAIISNLDLIISVDTSVAHLAGALGKETWILLPFSPDWRWLTKRDDSPWYPGMRLFRQSASGDWDSVFKALATALEQKIAKTNN